MPGGEHEPGNETPVRFREGLKPGEWPTAEEIAYVHRRGQRGKRWSRDWSKFDFSDCKHPLMVGLTDLGSRPPDWHVDICPACGHTESQCSHNTFEWNEAGTLLRCTTCGVDGT